MKIEDRIDGFLHGKPLNERDNRNLSHLNLNSPYEVSGNPRGGDFSNFEVSDHSTVHRVEGKLFVKFPININGTDCALEGDVTFSYEYEEKNGVKDETGFDWDVSEDTFRILSKDGNPMAIMEEDGTDVTIQCINDLLLDMKGDMIFENRMIEAIISYIQSNNVE